MALPSYAVVVLDWESLLTALDELVLMSPYLEPFRARLRQQLEETRRAKARQESAQAAKQRATQELNELLQEGWDLAQMIRGAVPLQYGRRNEELVRFGLKPLRKRLRSTRTAEPALEE